MWKRQLLIVHRTSRKMRGIIRSPFTKEREMINGKR